MNLTLMQEILISYLIIINIVTFFTFLIDKIKSTRNSWRISEKCLWGLCLFGGSLGGLLSMKLFRHKTKKISFQAILVIIIAIQIGLVFFILNSL